MGAAWWAESQEERSRNCWDLFLVLSLVCWGHIQQGRCRWRWEAPAGQHSQPCSGAPGTAPGAQPANLDLAEKHPSLHAPTQPREPGHPSGLLQRLVLVLLKSVRFLPWTSVRTLGVQSKLNKVNPPTSNLERTGLKYFSLPGLGHQQDKLPSF